MSPSVGGRGIRLRAISTKAGRYQICHCGKCIYFRSAKPRLHLLAEAAKGTEYASIRKIYRHAQMGPKANFLRYRQAACHSIRSRVWHRHGEPTIDDTLAKTFFQGI